MKAQKITKDNISETNLLNNHESSVSTEGLDDLFAWALQMVSDGENLDLEHHREEKIGRKVIETVQHLKEKEAVLEAQSELTYLQRRLIAILQKLQEMTEESAYLKAFVVLQGQALERIPVLEEEIKQLKQIEQNNHSAQGEIQDLLQALSKIKIERDFLNDLLNANEEENQRLVKLLDTTRTELEELKSHKWWHVFTKLLKFEIA